MPAFVRHIGIDYLGVKWKKLMGKNYVQAEKQAIEVAALSGTNITAFVNTLRFLTIFSWIACLQPTLQLEATRWVILAVFLSLHPNLQLNFQLRLLL